MTYLPGWIDAERAFAEIVQLCCYNRDGHLVRRGTVTRKIQFEGFEDVEGDGVLYADCPRLRITTRIRVRWGPRVDLTEYVWLADGVGEVRRTERIQGFVFLTLFGGVYTYELMNTPHTVVRASGAASAAPRRWSRCAVFLESVFPNPLLGGLIIEYAVPPTSGLTGGGSAPSDAISEL